ncbi:MAG TPA: sigma 54-interacting transcriptional regulator [Polyangiaceae bacterium]|jgi:transcriptional regulator with GAF, ATPase, and Fis domain|nr:sigma 54-interacting transcriptional regulator [Polyangiaceae bacterium]
MILLDVTQGLALGARHESSSDIVRLGRAAGNDVVLPDEHVSGEHARIVCGGDRYFLRDLRSTNGTAVVRQDARIALDESNGREVALESGDLIELGTGDRVVRLAVTLSEGEVSRFLAMRKIDELGRVQKAIEHDDGRLRALYEAQKRIGTKTDLNELLVAICEAAFALVAGATHVTIVLRDDDDDGARSGAASYVPIVTRVRDQQGPATQPIPITRSVFRKVVVERAAVIAADAAHEMGHTESLMGAQIQSVLAVPLWKGEEILGVLQMDNRQSPGVFTAQDLDLCAVLAHHASLSVANARLFARLRAAEERLKKENTFLKTREESRRVGKGQQEIIGQAPVMLALLDQLNKVVDTRVSVLIEGETGVGKELIAAAVHYRSRRRGQLFISQNCAAMPENLLESELFGHRKGSFTGAHEDKKGLFEIADGGTLFLDEVTEMPLALQSKLLRVLQEGEIRALGALQEKRVNVRIVAATNRTLEKEVEAGRFRQDLYYRLNVFPLRVPPLRERKEDIPLLAEHFLARYAAEMGKEPAGFAQETMELLTAYEWPGNIRELQNEVQRMVILGEDGDFLTPDTLSGRIRHVERLLEQVAPAKGTLKDMMDQVERWLVMEALREHDNNKTAAAKTLGITREGLHKKLRGLGL